MSKNEIKDDSNGVIEVNSMEEVKLEQELSEDNDTVEFNCNDD